MAQGNYYAPLYFSTAARGKMSPLGAPAAIKPYEKKKGLGDKMASALGSMMDQAMEADKVSKKERAAQLRMRNQDIVKKLPKRVPAYNSGEYYQSPIITEEVPGMNDVQMVFENPDYVPRPNPYYDIGVGDPSLLEMELFENQRELKALEGTETRSSGFKNEQLNNQILYPYKKSSYFDEQPTVKNQGAIDRMMINYLKS